MYEPVNKQGNEILYDGSTWIVLVKSFNGPVFEMLAALEESEVQVIKHSGLFA